MRPLSKGHLKNINFRGGLVCDILAIQPGSPPESELFAGMYDNTIFFDKMVEVLDLDQDETLMSN